MCQCLISFCYAACLTASLHRKARKEHHARHQRYRCDPRESPFRRAFGRRCSRPDRESPRRILQGDAGRADCTGSAARVSRTSSRQPAGYVPAARPAGTGRGCRTLLSAAGSGYAGHMPHRRPIRLPRRLKRRFRSALRHLQCSTPPPMIRLHMSRLHRHPSRIRLRPALPCRESVSPAGTRHDCHAFRRRMPPHPSQNRKPRTIRPRPFRIIPHRRPTSTFPSTRWSPPASLPILNLLRNRSRKRSARSLQSHRSRPVPNARPRRRRPKKKPRQRKPKRRQPAATAPRPPMLRASRAWRRSP